MNVINLMCAILSDGMSQGIPDAAQVYNNQNKISKILTGIKVYYTVPGESSKTYRINGLGPTARDHEFETKGIKCTIEQYFAKNKKYKLRYPDVLSLWVGKKDAPKMIYLPAEVRKPSHIL